MSDHIRFDVTPVCGSETILVVDKHIDTAGEDFLEMKIELLDNKQDICEEGETEWRNIRMCMTPEDARVHAQSILDALKLRAEHKAEQAYEDAE